MHSQRPKTRPKRRMTPDELGRYWLAVWFNMAQDCADLPVATFAGKRSPRRAGVSRDTFTPPKVATKHD